MGSWGGYSSDIQPDMQMWSGQLGSTATGQEQLGSASYPQAYVRIYNQ